MPPESPAIPAPADGDAAVVIPVAATGPASIYDVLSRRRRSLVLLAAAFVSILVPFSDTIYLPALHAIDHELGAGPAVVAASISVYMAAVGLAALVWGPCSDRFGRRPTYLLAGALFVASTVGLVFAPGVGPLLALRTLQGASVAAYVAVGNGVIADIFPPAQRGTASGLFMVPLLIGPVIGPVLGGWLAQAFSWRSTFVALAAFGVLAAALVLLLLPETQQAIVLRRLEARSPGSTACIKEAEAIRAQPPVFQAPWVPLRYLTEPAIAPHALLASFTFGANFASLTELPGVLAVAPYSLSAGLIGLAFLSDGVSGFAGSPIGGWLSDRAAAAHPHEPEARLLHNTVLVLAAMPAGLALFAWVIHARAHLAGIVVAQFLIGFSCAAVLPGVFSYLTTSKDETAGGAAAAAVQAAMFVLAAGLLIPASSAGVRAVGFGMWFTLLAALQAAVGLVALLQILRKMRRRRRCGGAGADPGLQQQGEEGVPAANLKQQL